MNQPSFTQHTNRAILCISGKDATDILQSTLTQNIEKAAPNKLLYSALLNPQGKILYDFFIAPIDDVYWIECLKEELIPIAKELHKYVITKDVTFEDLSGEYTVLTGSPFTKNKHTYKDPRHTKLPERIWLPKRELKNYFNISKNLSKYTKKRIQLKVPENDFIKGKTILNEIDFERINGVSFEKGCYVGQEITTRTKFRGTIKKKLEKILLPLKETQKSGTEIKTKKNQEAGWVLTNIEGAGLAIIRTRHRKEKLYLPTGEEITICN